MNTEVWGFPELPICHVFTAQLSSRRPGAGSKHHSLQSIQAHMWEAGSEMRSLQWPTYALAPLQPLVNRHRRCSQSYEWFYNPVSCALSFSGKTHVIYSTRSSSSLCASRASLDVSVLPCLVLERLIYWGVASHRTVWKHFGKQHNHICLVLRSCNRVHDKYSAEIFMLIPHSSFLGLAELILAL